MANSRHYLNGVQIEEPRNWQDLEVTMDWSKGKIDSTISLDALEFAGQAAIDIIARMNGGLSGGLGYFEGEPYRVEIGELLNPAMTFNGYLDFTDNPITKDCNIVQVALKREQGEDWINDVADGFSYRYLASDDYNGAGKIVQAEFRRVPYVINYIPDGVELLILSISTFMLTKELVESIKGIVTQTKELIASVIPTVGGNAGGPVAGVNIGAIVGAIISLAVQIAYTIGIVFALVKLIEQIIEQLAPVKRFHLGLSIKQLFQKACDHLGLEFKSTLIDNLYGGEWIVIPSKGHKGGSKPAGADNTWRETGVPTSSDGLDTFAAVIRTFKGVFNADFKIKDGVFEFERVDYWKNTSSFVIPDTFVDQDNYTNPFTVNTSDIKANYTIFWGTDQQDQNTLDNANGRLFQAVTSTNTVGNQKLVNIKGLKENNIPFSMAVRKDKLTAIEEVLKVFLQAADFLSGQLDQPNSFAAQFSARIGAMHLSSHFTGRPKMVVMSGNSLALDQRSILDARRLWDNYHFIESFVTIDNENAQRVIVNEQTIPFCFQDFVLLVNNNYCENEAGERAEIKTLNWMVEENTAVVSYEIERVYDNNLKITFLNG